MGGGEAETIMDKGAIFSDNRKYRYALWRTWHALQPQVMFIGLNPSTADETTDDQTIRRCVNFAKDWGFGGIYMLNLFAFRATQPSVMKEENHPSGRLNHDYIDDFADGVDLIVAAWGANGDHMRANDRITALITRNHPMFCLGRTADGHPKHPSRLAKVTPLVLYRGQSKLEKPECIRLSTSAT